VTGETTWTDPNSSANANLNGNVNNNNVNANSHNGKSSGIGDSQEEWRENRAPDGRVYYYNSRTRETSWSRPSSLKRAPSPARNATSNNSSNVPPLPPGWVQNTAPDGRPYYYHAITRETRWERPSAHAKVAEETGPPKVSAASSALPPGWVEYKANNGRPYYYNASSNRTSWIRPQSTMPQSSARPVHEAPPAVSQGPRKRPRIASADKHHGKNPQSHIFRRPRDAEGNTLGNRAAEVWLRERAAKKKADKLAAVAASSKEEKEGHTTDGKNVKDEAILPKEELTAYERKLRFMEMLDERGVDVKSTWFRAMALSAEDPRYMLPLSYGERKTIFHAWLQKKKSAQDCEQVKKTVSLSNEFLAMLEKYLDNEPMHRRGLEDCRPDALRRVRESPEYRAIASENTRNTLSRTFFDNRKRSHEHKKADDRRRFLDIVRTTLDAMTEPSIRPVSIGKNAKDVSGGKEYGPPWLDDRSSFREVDRRLSSLPFHRDIDSRDLKDVFEDWIRDVDKMVEDKRHRDKEVRKAQQKIQRAKFREGVLEMMMDGRISFRAEWREAGPEIGKQAFACHESGLGERPALLFKDALEMFDNQVHKHKETFKEHIRESGPGDKAFEITDSTTLDDLKKIGKKMAEFIAGLPGPVAEALLLDRQRKEQRRRQHAITDFEEMLRDLLRSEEIKLGTTYEDAKSTLEAKKETRNMVQLVKEDMVKRTYEEFIERRKSREARRAKRRLNEERGHVNGSGMNNMNNSRHYQSRGRREEETGWAAAVVSAKPATAAEKAAALEKRKRDLLASLKAGKPKQSPTPSPGIVAASKAPQKVENVPSLVPKQEDVTQAAAGTNGKTKEELEVGKGN